MSKIPKQKVGKKAGNQTRMIKYKQEKLQTKHNTRTWQMQQNAGESRHEDRENAGDSDNQRTRLNYAGKLY